MVAIKSPGTLRVTTLEIMPEGTKVPLSAWDVSANQLRQTWRSGLLSTGYFVIVPWKHWPATTKLHVLAKFTAADGTLYCVAVTSTGERIFAGSYDGRLFAWDKEGKVVFMYKGIKPWRMGRIVRRGKVAVELPEGVIEATQTAVGDAVQIT